MVHQWIEGRVVQRVSLKDGLVLNLDEYNELVISGPLRLAVPPAGDYPVEVVAIDPCDMSAAQRPLLNLAGSMCTRAVCDEDGHLHLEFSSGHQIDVAGDEHLTAWELYGKHHGYAACLPGGDVHMVRHGMQTSGHTAAQ
jgi:hypothetical protein